MDQLQGAVLGAHAVSLAHQTGCKVPSIFDYLALESMRDSLKPALLHLIKATLQLTSNKMSIERKLLSLMERRIDEFYLLFHLILENYYLKSFSGSFAENFYGIKRVHSFFGSFAMLRDRICSLVILVLFPYFTEKLDKLRTELQFQGEEGRVLSKWQLIFFRLYPKVKALLSATFLLFQVAYAFSWLSTPSPLLLLANCRLEKIADEELANIQLASQVPLHIRGHSIFGRLWRLFLWLPSATRRLFTYGFFLLQFMQYCYNSKLGKRFSEIVCDERITIPEHPFHSLPNEQQALCIDADKCPLCKRVRQNDTVLSVSGFVFCHSCIYNFILIRGCCPVTKLPATTKELIKIYL